MPGKKTGSRTPLLNMPDLCFEDGPSLSMAGDLRGSAKLQSFPAISHIHDVILFLMLRGFRNMDLERDIK